MNGHPEEHHFADRLQAMAEERSIPWVRTDRVDAELTLRVRDLTPRVIVGGGTWRSILGEDFLTAADYGYISMHGSGLPAYRGWCPINWQILQGEEVVVSRMFQLAGGVDSGPLVVDSGDNFFEVRVDARDRYYGEILEELAEQRLPVYGRFLDHLVRNEIRLVPQYEPAAFYGCNRSPDDGEVDWSWPTRSIYDFIRGQAEPGPGAFSFSRNECFHIWRARIPDDAPPYAGRIPGKVINRNPDGSADILTGDGALRLERITTESGEAVEPAKFLVSVRETLGYQPRQQIRDLEARIAELERCLEDRNNA
jgi:methionyl-tRNA formyltransferase